MKRIETRILALSFSLLLTGLPLVAQEEIPTEPPPKKTGPGSFLDAPKELLPPPPPDGPQMPPPDDVAAPPADAERTPSGLATKLLEPGTGDRKVGPEDLVRVRYTGWTTDGVTFETTVNNKTGVTFRAKYTIPGFGEGLMLMVKGEKRRMWIPVELAYKNEPGRPQGMLVFDLEVEEIQHAPPPPPDLDGVPATATRTDSGLAYLLLAEGAGDRRPGPESMVHAHFSVWRPDGSLIDTTLFKAGPVYIRLNRTLPGFAEVFPQMLPGEKRRLWLPAHLARVNEGDRLPDFVVIEVELLDFIEEPETPVDVEGPPEDAERTASGVAYRILRDGTGQRHPQQGSTVEAHYAGWTTDGKMFDASYDHGTHGTFTLDESMPKGWNEVVALMVEGERRRIWIPAELAYADQPERPQGMLVFEVELLAIRDE